MAFYAKLFIEGEERTILDAAYTYNQMIDATGRPYPYIQDGKINFSIASTSNDEFFYNWMFSSDALYGGYIRFYKRDGVSKLFDYEFANCYCLLLHERFVAKGTEPLKMQLVLSPGIQRVRGIIFEKKWNPDNPYTANQVPITVRDVDKNPVIQELYYTDMNGEQIPDDQLQVGTTVYLVITTTDAIGKEVAIDLDDSQHDFTYNGKLLPDDRLEGLMIKTETQKVELEITFQKQ